MAAARRDAITRRKQILSHALTAAIADGIGKGNYVITVVCAVGIAEKTYYEWMRKGRDVRALVEEHTNDKGAVSRTLKLTDYQRQLLHFVDTIEQVEATAEMAMLARVGELANETGNATVALEVLARRFQKRWGRGVGANTFTVETGDGVAEKGVTVNLAFALPATVEREEEAA